MSRIEKKARLKEWRDAERAAARASLPIEDAAMEQLFAMLEGEIPNQGCNHTRAITDAWLVEHGHPLEQVHQWLEEHGGYCDCEVLANAEQAWRFASAK